MCRSWLIKKEKVKEDKDVEDNNDEDVEDTIVEDMAVTDSENVADTENSWGCRWKCC